MVLAQIQPFNYIIHFLESMSAKKSTQTTMFTAGTSSHHVPWELHAGLLKAEVRRSQPVASLSPR